jgi:ABC-type uncharacterized transport system ATPase subunit
MTVLLSVQGVTKRFGGLQALTHVTFDLPEGQILGLIGPNGAGKTTLFNAINGIYPPEEGRIIFREKDVTALKTYERARMGSAHPPDRTAPERFDGAGKCDGWRMLRARKPESGSRGQLRGRGDGIRRVDGARRSTGRQPQRRAKEAPGNGPVAGSTSLSPAT